VSRKKLIPVIPEPSNRSLTSSSSPRNSSYAWPPPPAAHPSDADGGKGIEIGTDVCSNAASCPRVADGCAGGWMRMEEQGPSFGTSLAPPPLRRSAAAARSFPRAGFTLPTVERFPPTSGIGKPAVNHRKPLETARNDNSNLKNR